MNTVNFGKKLRAIREHLDINQGVFATSLGLKQGSYSMVEGGKNLLSGERLSILADKYSVNLNWLLQEHKNDTWHSLGIASAFTRHSTPNIPKEDEKPAYFTKRTPENLRDLLEGEYNLVIPAKARAGYAAGWSQEYVDDQIELCKIPIVKGRARTFEIVGDSMEPQIVEGDFICCTPIENPVSEIKNGDLYCIITRESGIYIKYLHKTKNGVTCISSNEATHKPFFMPFEEIREVWEAQVKLIYNLYSDEDRRITPILTKKLRDIDTFMRTRFPDYPQEDD